MNKIPKKYYMKNKCEDCGRICSGKRCRKCQDKRHSQMMKGKNNYFFGKHFIGENNSCWKGDSATKRKKYFCKDCNEEINWQSALYGEGRCHSCAQKGELNTMFGKSGKLSPTFGKIMIIPNKVIYKRTKMRSKWEMLYAKWLDRSRIKWLYEPKTFDLGNATYTPDFYLSEINKYIEIKGYFTDYAKNKIKKFKKLYLNINFEILREKELKQMGVL